MDDKKDSDKPTISEGVSNLLSSTVGALVESAKSAAKTAAEAAKHAMQPDPGTAAEKTNEQVYIGQEHGEKEIQEIEALVARRSKRCLKQKP